MEYDKINSLQCYTELSKPTMYVSVLLVEANENQCKNKNPSEKQCHLFRTCYAKEAVHSHFLLGETNKESDFPGLEATGRGTGTLS